MSGVTKKSNNNSNKINEINSRDTVTIYNYTNQINDNDLPELYDEEFIGFDFNNNYVYHESCDKKQLMIKKQKCKCKNGCLSRICKNGKRGIYCYPDICTNYGKFGCFVKKTEIFVKKT